MNKYDFDKIIDRRGTDSLKWDVKDNELPMWVADMDFMAADEIRQAFIDRIGHGVFGYSNVTDEWYDAYINWWNKRHHFQMKKDGLIFCTGVIPAISSIIRKLTTPNENVVILTPVYNIFYNCIRNNGARVLESELVFDGMSYSINFDDLEEKLSDPQTSILLLSNPHNPIGIIWDKETLKKIGELCYKYGVTVISDEIHCDIVRPGFQYEPFASVSDINNKISISLIAPTKAFNLAGLQTSAVYVSDVRLHHKVWRALNTDEVAEPNSFATVAAITAFTKGEQWINELNGYVFDNRDYVNEFMEKNITNVKVINGDATYLVWLDFRSFNMDSKAIARKIRDVSGLFLSSGDVYGPGGNGFVRLNVACPRAVLDDGLSRLKSALEAF